WRNHWPPNQAVREQAHGRITGQSQSRERGRHYARGGEGDQGTGLQESWPRHSCSEWKSALEAGRPSSQDRRRTRSFEEALGGLSQKAPWLVGAGALDGIAFLLPFVRPRLG